MQTLCLFNNNKAFTTKNFLLGLDFDRGKIFGSCDVINYLRMLLAIYFVSYCKS